MTALSPMRILLVEDDQATRDALAKAIRSFGHTCETAKDGEEAWQSHQREPADVIISDWSMPRMSGDELCQAVRLHDGSRYTHFIFATAKGAREDILRRMRIGADDYLVKPINLEQLELRLASTTRMVSHERLIAQRNVRLRRESERFYKAAHVDPLTSLGNRLQLEEDVRHLRTSATLRGSRWTLAICDIDWFKAYNDRYGHLFGDRALAAAPLQRPPRYGPYSPGRLGKHRDLPRMRPRVPDERQFRHPPSNRQLASIHRMRPPRRHGLHWA